MFSGSMAGSMGKNKLTKTEQQAVLAPSQARMKAKGKAEIEDDSIMGTNNSSIVSKRSVERLYYPQEPHFFRYFVKKPQRRAPLINRGYYVRMKAVDQVVHRFLERKSIKQKIVINLGCGYDPLPWQCLTRYFDACQNVKFIDIDYRDLMLKKQHVVQNTKELSSLLTNLEVMKEGDLLLRSDQYIQLGCDLRDLSRLHQALVNAVDVENCQVLFTAEVSITYMSVQAADSLIKWASALPEAQFCLLEQLLPDGMGHPFAQTMMGHFEKLNTPLRPVQKYPSTKDQKQRFKSLGWTDVSARNLWELWSAPDFMNPTDRIALDKIEAFDEWEEFALFGHHYVLLVADNVATSMHNKADPEDHHKPHQVNISTFRVQADFAEYPKGQGFRRFAAPLVIKSPNRCQDRIGNFAGMGLNTRLNSYDVYTTEQTETGTTPFRTHESNISPSSRMCHTITDLGDAGALLVGGRTSPDNALADCWLYHKWLNAWERVDDLPKPRYRHSAVNLGHGYVLVATGRSNSQTILDEYVIWSRRMGWVPCITKSGDGPLPVYGAILAVFPWEKRSSCGFFAGGISRDGILQQGAWIWNIENVSGKEPLISFTRYQTDPLNSQALARFGAAVVNHNDQIWVVGGILNSSMLMESEICIIDQKSTMLSVTLCSGTKVPRPLLMGISAISSDGHLVIMGGSAVCFSFGTFWNKGSYTLQPADHIRSDSQSWKYLYTVEPAKPAGPPNGLPSVDADSQAVVSIPRTKVESAAAFLQILGAGKPAILEGLNLGSCTTKWTSKYLKEHVGTEREVVVHKACAEHMNFMAKNFAYVTKKFGDFVDEIDGGSKLYLRSLSVEKPSEFPADIRRDFPSIADDFRLPPELSFVIENAHSSPLRISGPVIMWLHYDVMANVLCQIRGSKRLLLFPPSDVRFFDFEPGASSSSINVFNKLNLITGQAHPHEALLEPGDVLFLPPLWLHTAYPTSRLSIAVNVFFRNLQSGYAAGKDVYGNRDLQAYEKGRLDIAKIIRSFGNLPADVRTFYLQRLADEFGQSVC